MSELCPEDRLNPVLSQMDHNPDAAIEQLETLIAAFPQDARLHFLKGSALLGLKRYIEGHDSLKAAVDLAPDFAIARFQLGLFQLTSGEADAALTSWGPLDRLPDEHYLRAFVDGLRHLIRDDFDGAISALQTGISRNEENAPLNRDMQMLIGEIQTAQAGTSQAPEASEPGDRDSDDAEDAETSETAFLLGQHVFKPGRA